MRFFVPVVGIWSRMSLLQRYCLTGGAVILAAILIVGAWVEDQIERSVVANRASSVAHFLDSFIAPLAQDLAEADRLPNIAETALDELMQQTTLGDRVVSYKIWKAGGLVVYASDPSLIGRTFRDNASLRTALSGAVSATFIRPADWSGGDPENEAESALGIPLLEVYSPIREVWSGDVIAVAEFYEVAEQLSQDIAAARRQSWLVVAGTLLACGAALFGIVSTGSRTILQQQRQLKERIEASDRLAAENAQLRRRAISASARASSQAERRLRQVSADLHDGPGQNLSLAALRLERIAPDTAEAQAEARTIRDALVAAMADIRTISRGLSVPELEDLHLGEVAARAVASMSRQSGRDFDLSASGDLPEVVGQSVRIAVYRFIQEGLSNAIRHAEGAAARVFVEMIEATGEICVSVVDDGPGFDPEQPVAPHSGGGSGLWGMRDRIESLGGSFVLKSAPGAGTRISMTIAPETEVSHG